MGRALGEAHRRYTNFIHARGRWTGHLFQSRFASVAMDESHLREPARALTLKSRKAVQAIANFCGHRKSNPGTAHRFRFLTTARAGIEQGWPVASRLVYRF